jgi:hypothetical protein
MNEMDRLSHVSKVSWTRRGLASLPPLALVLAWAASAEAAVYHVYTSTISATTKNANDNYCSLAEAIDSVNMGSPQWKCQDAFPGSSPVIQFWEGSGGSFTQRHFKIDTLTISKSVALIGSGAYIDSTGTSGLVIGSQATVEISGLNLTHTGTSAGRLIHNQGTLSIYSSYLTNGDVSTLSGSSASSGNGGAIYNSGTGVISYMADDVTLSSNKAKLGGAIYNSGGEISDLRAGIYSNIATVAGGGIFNNCTNCTNTSVKGSINANSAEIMANAAISGGGVFNRGVFYMSGSYITLNTASGTGSELTTPGGQSLDGAGGGIVSTPYSSTTAALLNTNDNSSISGNYASGNGGAVYNAGQANLVGVVITDNRAVTGAAIFSVPQGSIYYCQIGNSGSTTTISNNILHAPGSSRYSILDGILITNDNLRKCLISNTSAWGNTPNSSFDPPRYCRSSMLRSSAGSVCPQ